MKFSDRKSLGGIEIFKVVALFSIRVYQLLLSPLLGRSCRYYPSCSEYTYESICMGGVIRGSWSGLRRILRCHPWSAGGFDPPNLSNELRPGHGETRVVKSDASSSTDGGGCGFREEAQVP